MEIELIIVNRGRFTMEATNNGRACLKIKQHPSKDLYIYEHRWEKRDILGIGKFFTKVGDAIVDGAKDVGNAVVDAGKKVGNAIATGAEYLYNNTLRNIIEPNGPASPAKKDKDEYTETELGQCSGTEA